MKLFKEILLIEDEVLFQFIVRTFIEKMGIAERLICKSNGKEALAFLKDTCLADNKLVADDCSDLILLDLNMPVMDGFAFLQALKGVNAESLIHSNVVVLTSSNDATDKKGIKEFGVKAYIQKPLTIEKLQSILP